MVSLGIGMFFGVIGIAIVGIATIFAIMPQHQAIHEDPSRRKSMPRNRSRKPRNPYDYKDQPVDELQAVIDSRGQDVRRRPRQHLEDDDDNASIKSDDTIGSYESALDEIDFELEYALDNVDQLYDTGSINNLHNAIQRLERLTKKLPPTAEIWCKIAKAYHALWEADDNNNEWLNKAFRYCKTALNLDERCAEVHKWYAILVGCRLAGTQPQLDQISDAKLLKQHVDLSLQLNKDDEVTHHLLGRYCYDVAGLSWIEKCVTGFSATYEEALSSFMTAEYLAPYHSKENKLYVAKCLIALGKSTTDIKTWLDGALASTHRVRREASIVAEIRSLRQKYM